jgi:hypothetical protein
MDGGELLFVAGRDGERNEAHQSQKATTGEELAPPKSREDRQTDMVRDIAGNASISAARCGDVNQTTAHSTSESPPAETPGSVRAVRWVSITPPQTG